MVLKKVHLFRGLGKTLQTLALIWTLLKQGIDGKPTINRAKKERVIIITTATLIQVCKTQSILFFEFNE